MYRNYEHISILIVDDHPIVLQGLQSLLLDRKGMEVAGCFTTGQATLDFLKDNTADLILLDVNLPDVHGIELCLEIKRLHPHIKVLVLSNHSERSVVTQMLQNGAIGYIMKNVSSKELLSAIQDAMQNKLVLNQEVQKILVQSSSYEFSEMPQLTRREKEILQRIAEGLTTAQIAEQLFISPLTVETHRRNLMQKLKVNNAPALIRLAIEHKLI